MMSAVTCDVEYARRWPAKHPGATWDYAVDFELECSRLWEPWQDYTAGQRIRIFNASAASGFDFEVTTAGRTAGRQPVFPSVVAQTVTSGSVVFTCRALSTGSLIRTIVGTPTWVADTGVTVSDVAVSGQKAVAKISGGTDGQDYAILVTATCSDGLVIPETVILPVRIPARGCA